MSLRLSPTVVNGMNVLKSNLAGFISDDVASGMAPVSRTMAQASAFEVLAAPDVSATKQAAPRWSFAADQVLKGVRSQIGKTLAGMPTATSALLLASGCAANSVGEDESYALAEALLINAVELSPKAVGIAGMGWCWYLMSDSVAATTLRAKYSLFEGVKCEALKELGHKKTPSAIAAIVDRVKHGSTDRVRLTASAQLCKMDIVSILSNAPGDPNVNKARLVSALVAKLPYEFECYSRADRSGQNLGKQKGNIYKTISSLISINSPESTALALNFVKEGSWPQIDCGTIANKEEFRQATAMQLVDQIDFPAAKKLVVDLVQGELAYRSKFELVARLFNRMDAAEKELNLSMWIDLLEQYPGDEESTCKALIATKLGEIKATQAVQPLIEELRYERKYEEFVVWALGNIGSKEAIPALVAKLKEYQPDFTTPRSTTEHSIHVFCHLVEAIDKIENNQTSQTIVGGISLQQLTRRYVSAALSDARESGSTEAYWQIAESLSRISYHVTPNGHLDLSRFPFPDYKGLAVALKDSDPKVRTSAIRVLGVIAAKVEPHGEFEAKSELGEFLSETIAHSNDPEVLINLGQLYLYLGHSVYSDTVFKYLIQSSDKKVRDKILESQSTSKSDLWINGFITIKSLANINRPYIF